MFVVRARDLVLAAVCCATSSIAVPCLAHIDLVAPAPRAAGRPDSNLATRPCGQRQNARSTERVSVFRPGQSIDVEWEVYVQHVSYFRIAFDVDGDDSFSARPSMPSDPTRDDPTALPAGDGELILGYIEDPTADVERVQQRVTLPNVQCDRCTLQVIQFTYGLPLADATYHQCADIVLEGPLADPAAEADAGGNGTASEEGGNNGCALALRSSRARAGGGLLLFALVLGGALLRRRAPFKELRGGAL
jgi:hypothetical protein